MEKIFYEFQFSFGEECTHDFLSVMPENMNCVWGSCPRGCVQFAVILTSMSYFLFVRLHQKAFEKRLLIRYR